VQTTAEIRHRSPHAAREVARDTPLRRARTCYGHLAGVAGVHLLHELLRRGWLEPAAESAPRPAFRLTTIGEAALHARGVDLVADRSRRRPRASACLDWTERMPHLAGPLGAAILQALERDGYLRRQPGLRAVTLLQPLDDWLADDKKEQASTLVLSAPRAS